MIESSPDIPRLLTPVATLPPQIGKTPEISTLRLGRTVGLVSARDCADTLLILRIISYGHGPFGRLRRREGLTKLAD